MDVSKLRPMGPWILVKVDPSPEKKGSIYLPQGNLEERLGYAIGTVVRVGQGIFSTPIQQRRTGEKFQPHAVEPGQRIVFRGFLQEANRPGGFVDREHCLLHAQDLLGVVEAGVEIEKGVG